MALNGWCPYKKEKFEDIEETQGKEWRQKLELCCQTSKKCQRFLTSTGSSEETKKDLSRAFRESMALLTLDF
jgi:hypothetical protein